MSDPREGKLPKWATELLAAERLRGDLAWPTEANPEPLFWADSNGYPGPKPDMLDRDVWIASRYGPEMRHVYSDRSLGRPDSPSSRSRPSGSYYATEREAAVAGWWKAANDAAVSLHRAAEFVRKAERNKQ
jgi:hypothetical protein